MKHPRAFISYDFDNNKELKELFAGQAKHSRTPFNIEDWSSKEHLPQKEWEELIKAKINLCDMLIVIVGSKTYQATGVVKEIKFASDQGINVFGVYVDGANVFTPLPTGLQRSRVIKWDWLEIAKWVSICSK